MLSILLIVGSNKAAEKVNYSDILSFPSSLYLKKFLYLFKIYQNCVKFHILFCTFFSFSNMLRTFFFVFSSDYIWI